MRTRGFGPGTVVEEYSEPGATAPPWEEVARRLDDTELFLLTTVRADGRPHAVPLPAMWLDGGLHFCTGAHEQKARNLAGNPAATLSTSTGDFRSGTDVVVEGTVAATTDEAVLDRLAARWHERLDWTFHVAGGAFVDPDAGHRAEVFRLEPTKVLVFTKGSPYAQVRYRPG